MATLSSCLEKFPDFASLIRIAFFIKKYMDCWFRNRTTHFPYFRDMGRRSFYFILEQKWKAFRKFQIVLKYLEWCKLLPTRIKNWENLLIGHITSDIFVCTLIFHHLKATVRKLCTCAKLENKISISKFLNVEI